MASRGNKNNDNLEISFAEMSLSSTPMLTRSSKKKKLIEDNSKNLTNIKTRSSKKINEIPKDLTKERQSIITFNLSEDESSDETNKLNNRRLPNRSAKTQTIQSKIKKEKSNKKQTIKSNSTSDKKVSPIIIKNKNKIIKSDKSKIDHNQTTEESNDESINDSSDEESINESSDEKSNEKDNLNDKTLDNSENYNPIFDYFKERSVKIKKSTNTINKIDFNMIKNVGKDLRYNNIKQLIIDHYKESGLFQEIYELMVCNFNVILYGFGSKRSLVNEFKKEYLSDENYLKIDGFYPQLNLKIILIKLSNLFDLESTAKEEDFYEEAINLEENIFLVINSIDQLFKTDIKIKKFLIKLYEKSNGHLHILSTIDHINASLMFDLKEEGKLNLVYLQATTHELYNLEFDFIKSSSKSTNKILDIDIQQKTMTSIISVYNTLPEHSKNVLKLIFRDWLKHQEFRKQTNKYDGNDDDDTKGLLYSNILRLCKQNFYSNSASTFKQQLVELKDHDLIKTIKIEGNEYINVLIEDHLIKMFLDEYDN